MRRLSIGLCICALAACSKAPDGGAGEPDIAGNASAGVAFDYSYSLMLPSARISDLQEEHARSCERLGVARCRITGLRYSVGSGGNVSASLAMRVASPLARAFGREGVKLAERSGAILTGANITGTDVEAANRAATNNDNAIATERDRIAQALARTGISAAERVELLRQQAALNEQARARRADTAERQESLANTPIAFIYETGRGTALMDRVRDAGDTALSSIGITLSIILWSVAALGPPLAMIVLLLLLWRRWGGRWWSRLVAWTDRHETAHVD